MPPRAASVASRDALGGQLRRVVAVFPAGPARGVLGLELHDERQPDNAEARMVPSATAHPVRLPLGFRIRTPRARDPTVRPAMLALFLDAGQCGQRPGPGLYPAHGSAADAEHAAVDSPEPDADSRLRRGHRDGSPPGPAPGGALAFVEGADHVRAHE